MAKLNITVCMGSSCFARGNAQNLELIENYIKDNLTRSFNIIDCGYFYIKHKDIKNNNF